MATSKSRQSSAKTLCPWHYVLGTLRSSTRKRMGPDPKKQSCWYLIVRDVRETVVPHFQHPKVSTPWRQTTSRVCSDSIARCDPPGFIRLLCPFQPAPCSTSDVHHVMESMTSLRGKTRSRRQNSPQALVSEQAEASILFLDAVLAQFADVKHRVRTQ